MTQWDHTDLFALGLPRSFQDKFVQINEMGFGELGVELAPAEK